MINSKPFIETIAETTALPVKVQVYEILTNNGFAISEALDLATKWAHSYTSTSQRVFECNSVKVEIMACQAKLIFAPRNHETLRRTAERIQVQQNLEISMQAAKIRQRREADERRGNGR